jgi:hypothetical protein
MKKKKMQKKTEKQTAMDFLKCELNKFVKRSNDLVKRQLKGDLSEETIRKLNIMNYKIEVLRNRMSGHFKNSYREDSTLETPKLH